MNLDGRVEGPPALEPPDVRFVHGDHHDAAVTGAGVGAEVRR